MADQYRDSCVDKQKKTRKSFNGRPNDPIRLSFYDKDGMRVNDITRSEANCIASKDPNQLFYFQDGDGYQRELLIDEVNSLKTNDLLPISAPPCPVSPQFCGPPKVQFFGGMGMGALANAIVSPNSSSIIGFDIKNPGFNYLKPPFAQLIDECGNGSGGKLLVRTKPYDGERDNGRKSGTKGGLEVRDIVITAPGDGYLSSPDGSRGGNGRVTDPAPDPNDPRPPSPPTASFTASKYLLNSSEEITLFWATENANTVNITEVGNSLPIIGNRKITVDRTKTYILTASGPGGTVTSTVTISLLPSLPPNPPIADPTLPPSIIFVASKYQVRSNEKFDLIWQVTNADSVTITPEIGFEDFSGKITLSILDTTTYILTAVGPGGTKSQKVTITLLPTFQPPDEPPRPPEEPGGPSIPKPVDLPTYKVLMCLDDIYVEDGGFGFVPGDTVKVVPDNGTLVELEINQRGEIVSVKVISKGCGYTDLPEIVIESQTGYNAKLRPVLSATPITDEQALFDIPEGVQLLSVVDCVGKILPETQFDRVPR